MDEPSKRAEATPYSLCGIPFTRRSTIALISCVLLVAIAALPSLGVIIVHGVIDAVGLAFIYLDADRILNHPLS